MENDLDPAGDEISTPSSAMDWITRQRRAAQSTALSSLDDNPDDASRAMELSESTGANPALVYGNLENFEQQHKAALTSALLTNNQYLREYANSHPLAAKVSNDDWGVLDAVSSRLGPFKQPAKSVLSVASQKFKEGFGEQEYVGGWLPDPEGNRLAWSLWSSIGMAPELFMRGVGGVTAGVLGGAGELGKQLGFEGAPDKAEQLTQAMGDPGFWASMGPLGEMAGMPFMANAALRSMLVPKIADAAKAGRPYFEAGMEPPVGVHPVLDQVHAEQAKLDMKNLDEVMKESQGSSTKERSPELFADFIRQHTDAKIGVDAEAVRKMYGNAQPALEDGKLGWVEDLQHQLATAEASGGDVEIPLADWIAKVDPEVAKELHDNIRVRPGGMTLEEVKGAKPVELEEPEKISGAAIRVGDKIYQGITHGEAAIAAEKDLGKEIDSSIDSDLSGFITNKGRYVDREEAKRIADANEQIPVGRRSQTGSQLLSEDVRRNYAVQSVRQSARLDEPLFAKDQVIHPPAGEWGIVPASATPYEGKEIGTPSGEKFSPYLNFPLRDAINQIDSKHLTGIPAVLYEFFADRLSKLAGDVPVRVVKDEDMKRISGGLDPSRSGASYIPAFYSPKIDEIYISDRIAYGREGHKYAAYAIMHEGAHALSVIAMREHPELAEKVAALSKEVQEVIKDNDPQLLQETGHAYAFKNPDEFWAQAWSDTAFQHTLSMMPMSEELAKSIGLKSAAGKNLYDAFRRIIKTMMQKLFPGLRVPDTMVDGLFHLQHQFEQVEAKARGLGEIAPAKPIEPELPGMTRLEDRDLFSKAAAIGMTKDQYQRYMKLIEKRQAEDQKFQETSAQSVERERQTQEWKENFDRVREQVQEDLKSRPDLAADRFLRIGELYGEKGRRVRLDKGSLTDEQLRSIPPDLVSDRGIHPDDAAGLFGYQSGDALVEALARLAQERELEGLTPAAHFSKLVDAETERQMRKQYGSLEENILAEAKDHVISQTQIDLLHEEMLALGTQAHGEMSISKEDVKAWVKGEFDRTKLGGISTDKYLASAGRAGASAEDALLKGAPADAFKAKQQQYISLLLANEAKKLEKEKKGFDKLAKQFSKREVGGVPAEFTNWIHDILTRTGNVVRRSVQDLQDAIGRETSATLEQFVNAKNADSRIWEDDPNAPSDFQIMPVASFLFDPNYRKTLDDMTPTEFRAVHNSIKTLIKNGRDENKIIIAGEKQDLAQTVNNMIGQLNTLFAGKEKQYAFGHKDQGVGHALRTYWASLLQLESIFNRFDKGDPKGIFQRVVTQPNIEGSNYLAALEKKYARMYRTLDFGDLKRRVENPVFTDPLSGDKGAMTRGNLLAVLQNVGNPSQLDKLARGYKVEDKNSIMQWLFRNTTKEDWDRAQALGDIFEKAFEESATMYHGLSGVAPEKIDIRPIETPFGTYKGWYHPIIYDPLRPGSSKKLMGQNPLEDGAYYRAATPSGYTQRRTGYAAPIQLNFDAIPFRLRQILNDIAMRPTVTETAKVFYDPKFQMAITKSYGKEIKDLLLPYLKDIAGQRQYKDATQTAASKYLEYARQNVIATLIGLNPSTVMKHGPTAAMLSIKEIGAKDFFTEITSLLSHSDELGERNWKFAMKGGLVDGKEWAGSEELQRRQRNWQETLTGAQADVFNENTLRNTVIKFGATPVAISDLLSAVPTWLASYKQQIRAGEAHGDAVAFADRSVRRAHGSSAVAARPRIMRGGALAQFATPFYTFFNEMFQRQYEMAWRAKDALGQFSEGEYKAGLKEVPNLAKGLWAYVVFPALVEQMVSPVLTGNEPTSVKLAGWGLRTVMSTLPGVRDLAEAFIGGRDPSVGLYSTTAKMLTDFGRDVEKGKIAFNRAHAGTTIKHSITAFGAMSGLTNAQEGRTAEFIYNYATGQERPRDIHDILKGLWHGTLKEPKR